jgi:hypothetical protein
MYVFRKGKDYSHTYFLVELLLLLSVVDISK